MTDTVRVPRDTGPNFSDSTLPEEMIRAGMAVFDQVDADNANYVAGETTDWDQGMIVVAIYRAMLAASPQGEGSSAEADQDALIERACRECRALRRIFTEGVKP